MHVTASSFAAKDSITVTKRASFATPLCHSSTNLKGRTPPSDTPTASSLALIRTPTVEPQDHFEKNIFLFGSQQNITNYLLTLSKHCPKCRGRGDKNQGRAFVMGVGHGTTSTTRKYNKPTEHISADFSSPETAPLPFPTSRKVSHLVFNSLMRGRRSRSIELSKFKLIAAITRLL